MNGAEQVICATGLPARVRGTTRCSRSSSTTTGSRRTADWIVLAPDCTVPGAHGRRRGRSALAGVAAQWAYPAADTLVGAKYAAHGFLRRVQGMSYTLRGRIDSRLLAALGPAVAAAILALVAPPLVAGRDRRR